MWALLFAVLASGAAVLASGLVTRAAGGGNAADVAASTPSHWVATWAASPQAASPRDPVAVHGFADQTVREIVFASVGGSRVRVRVTNRYGARPLRVGRAMIALDPGGGETTAGAAVPLSFRGSPSVTVAPGAEATSDPAPLAVAPLRDLAISMFLPSRTGPATGHALAEQLSYVVPGDEVGRRRLPTATAAPSSSFFLDDVSVLAPPDVRGAVVAVGDSITDGFGSTLDANQRWPNDLARRLDAQRGPRLSVVDEGIAGNRVLTGSACYGPSAVARFGADALSQPGARDVIFLEGTNDLGLSQARGACSLPHQEVSAAQVVAGDERIIRKAHRAGMRIFGATILPFAGSRYWTEAAEAKREAINRWILSSHAFDGVINLARVLGDPTRPHVLAPRYDSGDHLHPNDAGYQAIANAVDLTLLQRP